MASTPLPLALRAVLAATAALAIAGPALLVANPPHIPPPARTKLATRVVPKAEVPEVEPVALQDLTPADARAFNAGVPFSTDPNPAARPFNLGGGAEDRARAIDCMAAAMLYEAGDDPVGERAVGQVVINRTRHPAFPKTICGVVFQGQERSTGCQFTFTCDGAITRAPNPDAWKRAQALATQALTGRVYAPVGHSTHYHTDWVVPYWSASLDKVAEVHTHLFFRWTGWWGTPGAFRRAVSDAEPVIAKLAAWSPAHALAGALDDAAALTTEANAVIAGTEAGAGAMVSDPNTLLVTLDRKITPDLLPAFAKRACGERDYCRVMGWTEKRLTPTHLPLDPNQVAGMAFSYLRDRPKGFDKPLWNCVVFARADKRECMKVQVLLPRTAPVPGQLEATPSTGLIAAPPPGAAPRPAATPRPRQTLTLPVVTPVPAPTPTPSPRP